MAQDPRNRTFFVKPCGKALRSNVNEDSKRRDFFNSIGKVGDIEALNKIGAANISEGLRTLAKTSNSIRTGDTSSAIIQGGDANGPNAVLTTVGINPNEAEEAGKFNPGVLNRAQGQAQVIYDKVKQGQYTLKDIPNGVQDLQNLDQLITGIFTGSGDISSTRDLLKCGATPYATALIAFAPKYKFLFIVQVVMKAPYKSLEESGNTLAFVVKSSTRPNINIEHEEINMYNFWTRVPKRVEFEPITMRFYDDNKGMAHRFYKKYLNAISPITNLGGSAINSRLLGPEYLQGIGMNGSNGFSSASLGSLNRNVTTLIDEIKVFHIYDYGRLLSIYHYHHPKILSMNLDELDMAENGGGNEIELQFAFDALNITQDIKMQEFSKEIAEISSIGNATLSPMKGNFDESAAVDAFDDGDGADTLEQRAREASGANSISGLVSNAFNSATNFAGSIFDSPGGGDVKYGTSD